MPIVCFGCHGHAGTVQKDIDRLFGRIKKQQKSGREKEFEAVERNFFDVMGFKRPKIALSTLYYPYIKYPLGGTQNSPLRRVLIPGPSHLHSGDLGPNSGSSPLEGTIYRMMGAAHMRLKAWICGPPTNWLGR
jgi:hypothetical protein